MNNSTSTAVQDLERGQAPNAQRAPQAHVIQSLKQWMSDGALSAGSPLPSERALSEELRVTRGTVRRALQVLQDEGFLRTQNGRTRIVTQQHQRQHAKALRNTIALVAPLFSNRAEQVLHGGRIEFIGRGTWAGIQQIGKHAMSLNPEFLTRAEAEEIAEQQPFGVVITDMAATASREAEVAGWFRDAGTPVSVYGDAPSIGAFDHVASDQEDGAYQLTQFLIGKGRRRPLNFWVGPLDRYWYMQRRAGYERAMREAGLAPLPTVEMPPFPITEGDRAIFDTGVRGTVAYLVEHLVGPDPIDALMLSTDNDYFGVAAACRLCGKEPQRDVLIVGYDNYWFEDDKRAFEPTIPLASIDKRNEVLGGELVRLLSDRVMGHLPPEPQRRAVRPELVVPAVN